MVEDAQAVPAGASQESGGLLGGPDHHGKDALAGPEQTLCALESADRVQPPLMELISEHIAQLRRLDGRTGGGALSLRYVRGELQAVLALLQHSVYEKRVGDTLLLAAADLAQLSGWMHFDVGQRGAAQRYLLLGTRLARAAADGTHAQRSTLAAETAANIVGMLAYHAAHTDQPDEAVRLVDAAAHATRHASTATRARLAGRAATAHAARGDLYASRSSAEHARELLDHDSGDAPAFLYYLTPDQLAAESGQALVHLAATNPRRRNALLDEAVRLLTPLTSTGLRGDYQRSALLHGCYLAEAQLRDGELEAATVAADTAVQRLPGVQSGRCWSLLHRLRSQLTRRARNPHVAQFLPHLDGVLRHPRP